MGRSSECSDKEERLLGLAVTVVCLQRLSPGARAVRLEEHPPLGDSPGHSTAPAPLLLPPHRLAGAEDTHLLRLHQPSQLRPGAAHPRGLDQLKVDAVQSSVLLHCEISLFEALFHAFFSPVKFLRLLLTSYSCFWSCWEYWPRRSTAFIWKVRILIQFNGGREVPCLLSILC